MELLACQDLAVPREVMHHVVRVESSYNPYAIGVVGGHLVRQPRNLPEAVSTARMLEQRGYNFSLGLAQVNRYNLAKYGLASYEAAFQPCANLKAGSRILRECYGRSGGDWGKSFSCYYSGDFKTGFRHGYVQKVYASMRKGQGETALIAGVQPIAVIDRVQKRVVAKRVTERSTADAPAAPAPVANNLVERRGGPVQAGAPALRAMRELAANGVPTGYSVEQFAAMGAVGGAVVPQPPAPVVASAGGPVAVTATRLGASPAPPQMSSGQDDGDGAFVF